MINSRRGKNLRIAIFCLFFLGFGSIATAALTGPVLVNTPPQIDGILNESAWGGAFEVADFTVVDPETKAKPSLQTRVKFLYDQKNLYVGIINDQPLDKQVSRISARDKENTYVDRDLVRVVIDPSAQGLYGYTFDVYLGDSLTDGTVRPEREFTFNWDAPYQAVTTSDENHWYAEMVIPWDIMDFPSKEGRRIIGYYVQRDVAFLSERWGHPAILKNSPVFLGDFDKMDLMDINPQGKLTLFPYASAGYDAVLGERTQDVGVDAFWQATSNMLVSASINPDFGDVENDQVEANFDNTETLLQEKRTFFVQGQDIFETKGLNLINTRRIGDEPDEPPGQIFDYKPQISDILGAAKLTGSADKFRYGVITAFEDDSDYILNDGAHLESEGRNFYAARALFENASRKSDYIAMGYLGTVVDHERYDAMVNSVDAQWLTMGQKLRLEAQTAVSNNDRYPDKEVGYAYNGRAIYYRTPSSYFKTELDFMDNNFNHQDFGYATRLDRMKFNNEYRNNLSSVKGTKWLNYTTYVTGDYNDGNLLKTMIGGKAFIMFNNLQKAFVDAYYVPRGWNDINTYGHGSYRTKPGYFVWLSWFSDESKPFHVYINPRFYTEETGGLTKFYRGRIKYSPMDRWVIETEVTYWNKQHWIVSATRLDDRLIAYNADQIQLILSSNFKLTNKQDIRLSAQWIGIDAEGKLSYRIDAYGNLRIVDELKDFDYGQLISQIRYRYEFKPMCDLFVVYNRGGVFVRGDETDDFGVLLSDSWDDRDVDRFLVKIRYRF